MSLQLRQKNTCNICIFFTYTKPTYSAKLFVFAFIIQGKKINWNICKNSKGGGKEAKLIEFHIPTPHESGPGQNKVQLQSYKHHHYHTITSKEKTERKSKNGPKHTSIAPHLSLSLSLSPLHINPSKKLGSADRQSARKTFIAGTPFKVYMKQTFNLIM